MTDGENRRLDVLLREAGAFAKKETRLLVDGGRVTINGVPAVSAAEICPLCAEIRVDGKRVELSGPLLYVMHKPAGFVCTARSERYPTVFSLLKGPEAEKKLFCVGRLDADTTGLLLLTNDGSVCERLTRPESRVSKLYEAGLYRPLPPDAVEKAAAGVTLPEGLRLLPAQLTPLEPLRVLVEVTEGKYHEVKRLLRACGSGVRTLKRLRIGALRLPADLEPGEYRPLTPEERRALEEKTPVGPET